MGLVHYKASPVASRGGKNETRAQAAINGITVKIRRVAQRYRAVRAALLVLDSSAFKVASDEDPSVGRLASVYRELLDKDIANPQGEDPANPPPITPAERRKATLGEGHKMTPWIWTSVRYSGADHIRPTGVSDAEAIEGLNASYSLSSSLTCY